MFLFAKHLSVAMTKEKGLFLHAGLRCPFCFALLLFPVNVVMGYKGFNKVLRRWQKLWRRRRWKKLAPVSRVVQGHTPPPPPGKYMKSGPLGIHFQHSGAKIKVFEQDTDIIKF